MCDQSIVALIIPAASALGGVALGQFWASRIADKEREHKRQVLLREKYEELALALSQFLDYYLSLLSAKSTEEGLLAARPIHAQKVDVLAKLYFPELRSKSEAFLRSIVAFQNSLAVNYNPQSSQSLGEQGAGSTAVSEAQKNLTSAKHALDDAISKHATKYAIA